MTISNYEKVPSLGSCGFSRYLFTVFRLIPSFLAIFRWVNTFRCNTIISKIVSFFHTDLPSRPRIKYSNISTFPKAIQTGSLLNDHSGLSLSRPFSRGSTNQKILFDCTFSISCISDQTISSV